MLAIEVTRDRVHQDGERGEAPQATRLPHREDSLDPAIALLVIAALQQFPPEHREAEGPGELSEGIAPPAGLQNRACHFCGTRLLS